VISPSSPLCALLAIERARSHERPFANSPRTLDLDLILFGSAVIDDPDLVVPHSRFRERRFVFEPLADVAPDLVDPLSRLTIV
jgi:2-amino-4-hydroxy-6-hydroxymethyldihydropteridine diphosphokinase